MRNMLIKEIKSLSEEVDDDDLEWFQWDRYSNKELLEMFKDLCIAQYDLSLDI